MSLGKVLITGGAGVVGSTITDQLVRAGAGEIVVFDNLGRGRPENLDWAIANGSVSLVSGDIGDTAALRDAMAGCDVVFHQAAIRITQCAEEPALAMDVLVNGTFIVLDAARQAGVRKVVAASSASVYGLADRFPTDEQHHPYNNRTLYGSAKAFNEGLLRSFNEMFGLEYVALRYFNVYGPRMDIYGAYTEVFIRWMENIEAGKPPMIFGDGTQTMDFIFADDIARANILAARAPVSDVVYNVASGTEFSLNECAEMLLHVMKSDLKVEYGEARKVNGVTRRLASTWRAEQEIGFQAVVPFEAGLARLVEWWRQSKESAVLA